ncbi:MAG: O-antigen ligase family protein [Thermoleophilia bacterium]
MPLAFPMLGLLLINIVSSYLYSPDKTKSYQSCFLFALYLSMYFLTVNVLTERKELIKKIPFLLVAVGILQALYSLAALLLLSSGFVIFGASRSQESSIGISVNGGFQESNIFAAFIVVVTLMMLAHLIARSRWHKGLRLYAALALVFLMLLLTFTRAAWISFAAVALMTLFVLRPRTNFFNPRSLAVIAAMVAFFILVALPIGNYTSSFTGGSVTGISGRISNLLNFSEGSGGGRLEVQTRAIQRWEQNPILGDGTFAFPAEEAGTATPGSWLYSSLIQSLHDTGVVGFIFLLWIYIGGLVIGIRGYSQCKTVFWKATLAGSTLGWLALIIASQASSFLWLSFPWIFLGALVAWAKQAPELEQAEAATYKPSNLITQ